MQEVAGTGAGDSSNLQGTQSVRFTAPSQRLAACDWIEVAGTAYATIEDSGMLADASMFSGGFQSIGMASMLTESVVCQSLESGGVPQPAAAGAGASAQSGALL